MEKHGPQTVENTAKSRFMWYNECKRIMATGKKCLRVGLECTDTRTVNN